MKKTTFIASLILACSITLLSACGQKGPLYLPVKPDALVPQGSKLPVAAPASVSEPVDSPKAAQ